MTMTEELLVLKMTIKCFEEALAKNDIELMLNISVDISDSAQKLEKKTFDHANQTDA